VSFAVYSCSVSQGQARHILHRLLLVFDQIEVLWGHPRRI